MPKNKNPTILIYGFGPFRHYRRNITQALLQRLPKRAQLETLILPVRFEPELFLEPVKTLQPDYILGLGQCPRGDLLRLERKAWNLMRDKSQGLEAVIEVDGPASLPVTWHLPLHSDTRVSYDAGRYVCNFSMYTLSRYAQQNQVPYAFVHIPRSFSLNRAQAWLENLLNGLD